jgi:hypothetical protein
MALIHLETPRRGRLWAALVPFLQKFEFDAMLQSGNNFRLWDEGSAEDAWLRALSAARNVAAYTEDVTRPLPASLEPAARQLQAREVFQREYARKADVALKLVPLAPLISPQPLADMDYVAELAEGLSKHEDPERDFEFAFPAGSVPEPLVAGPTVIFNDQTQNIVINPMPEYKRVGDEVHITIRATARPNYVWVAEMGTRLVLLNGVHKVLAALKAGRTALPAVVRSASSLAELGLQQPPTFLAQLVAPRPPLVGDFFHSMAIGMERRPTRTLTRLIIQVDQIPAPE